MVFFYFQIGVITIEAGYKQAPLVFNSVCGKTIYSINWAGSYILVVCNDRIAVYEDNANNRGKWGNINYILHNVTSVQCTQNSFELQH